jgi:hypothetical protein
MSNANPGSNGGWNRPGFRLQLTPGYERESRGAVDSKPGTGYRPAGSTRATNYEFHAERSGLRRCQSVAR